MYLSLLLPLIRKKNIFLSLSLSFSYLFITFLLYFFKKNKISLSNHNKNFPGTSCSGVPTLCITLGSWSYTWSGRCYTSGAGTSLWTIPVSLPVYQRSFAVQAERQVEMFRLCLLGVGLRTLWIDGRVGKGSSFFIIVSIIKHDH